MTDTTRNTISSSFTGSALDAIGSPPVQSLPNIKGLLEALRDGPISRGKLAQALGLNTTAGYMTYKIMAAFRFGTSERGDHAYALTPLGRLLLSQDREEAERAYREAFANVPLFVTLRDRFGDDASVSTVKNALVEMGMPEGRLEAVARAFRGSISSSSFAVVDAKPRRAEPHRSQQDAVISSYDERSEAEWLFLQRMLRRLPKPGTPMDAEERANWIDVFVGVVKMTYPVVGSMPAPAS